MKTKSIEIGNCTDVGMVRSENQDYFGAYNGGYGQLIIVADGMGGHEGGEIASRLTVEGIRDHFESLSAEFAPRAELSNALAAANERIIARAADNPEIQDMGSTAVVLLIQGDFAYTAHAGDSRIYLIRSGHVFQLTKDHSLVQQMVDANMISAVEARSHPQKNIITRALGANKKGEPEVSQALTVFKGDSFLLCSDGLLEYVSDSEMARSIAEHPPQQAAELLVQMAKDRGGADNITVQVVRVLKGKRPPMSRNTRKSLARLALAAALIVAVAAVLYALKGSPSGVPGEGEKEENTAAQSDGATQLKKTDMEGETIHPPAKSTASHIIAIDIGHAESGVELKSCTEEEEYSYSKAMANTLLQQLKKAGFENSFIITPKQQNPSVDARVELARTGKAELLLSLRTGDPLRAVVGKSAAEKQKIYERCSGYSVVISIEDPRWAAREMDLGVLLGKYLREAKMRPFEEGAKMISKNREALSEPGVYQHDELEILKAAEMPVVRIEYGFIKNRADEKLLRNPEYIRRMAAALVAAVKEFFSTTD